MYVDDDWEPWASFWGQDLGLVYTDTTVISDPETTRALDYSNRLVHNYEWIQVCAHSWPGGHSFKYNGGGSWDHIYNYEIYGIDPHATFYNLFACSAARFVETNYVGGWYVFVDTYGLAAVGSTKTGSMLGFDEFYGPLAQGKLLGEAFQDWFEAVGIYDQAWHYGMTLLGDPTLTISGGDVGPVVYDSHTIDDDNVGQSSGNDDGIVNCGETIELYVDLYNQGGDTATSVNACLSEDSPYVDGFLINTCSGYGNIPGGGTGTNSDDFDFEVDPSTPDGHVIHFDLDITASNGGPWTDSFDVPVVCTGPDIGGYIYYLPIISKNSP